MKNGASTMKGGLTRLFVVLGILAAVLGGGGVTMLALAVRGGFSARDQPSAMEAVIARAMRSWSVPSRGQRLKNPVPNSPEGLSEARAHWADHCATCHANNGSGETQIGKNLYPKAPDMRGKGTQDLSDGELYFIIENGVRLTGMPAWGDGGEDSVESWKLVAFIRHLPSLTAEEEHEMESMNPRSLDERKKTEDDDEFLKTGAVPAPATAPLKTHQH